MATLPRCLCLLLALWMAGSRPSAALRSGSLGSGKWGTEARNKFQEEILALRRQGNFAAVEARYQLACEDALRDLDLLRACRFRMGVGTARFLGLNYSGALEAYLDACGMARQNGFQEDLEAVLLNLSALYQQVWDLDSALQAADEARQAAVGLPPVYNRAQLLLHTARLRFALGGEVRSLIEEGIQAAYDQNDAGLEAQGWEAAGDDFLRRRDLSNAERALTEAFVLRALRWRIDLPVSYSRWAELRLAQGRLPEAMRFVNLAIASDPRFSIPPYRLRHLRGRIRLAGGDRPAALRDFADAVDLAGRWRAVVLPAASSFDAANATLARGIFDSFIETAAAEAIRTGDPRWARESFQAVELNRAASLRQGIAWSEIWRRRLSPEFWQTLDRLRSEQARLLTRNEPSSSLSDRLNLKLTELQAKAGLGVGEDISLNNPEIIRDQSSLKHFQGGLSKFEVLLSFYLGENQSYLWAVTRKSISIRKIGSRREIGEGVRRFREAVQSGRSEARVLGATLYAEFFKTVPEAAISQPQWLLSLDGPLFDLPFGALVTERNVYIAEGHSLQIVPGALLLSSSRREGAGDPAQRFVRGGYIGVGDPIHNPADVRWPSPRPPPNAGSDAAMPALPRLVGSGTEIRASAESWTAAGGTEPRVLLGSEARRDVLLGAIDAAPPAILHLATHVLTVPQHPSQAFLALSPDRTASAQILTAQQIALLQVPGSLVILSGCQSASGDPQPGAGLLGMVRAWITAGAAGVIATQWPVAD